ncbi:hypothetical protein ACIQ34_11585 [Ureibacillus sp. NPDC094379]
MLKIDLHINKVLTLSTAHIKLDTAVYILDLIEQGKETGWNELVIYDKPGSGWMINTSDVEDEELMVSEDVIPMLPFELLDLLRLAKDHDCEWLCLNKYIEPMDGLPVFDWAEEINPEQDPSKERQAHTMYYHEFEFGLIELDEEDESEVQGDLESSTLPH